MTTEVFIVLQMLLAIVSLMIALSIKTEEVKELQKAENIPLESYSDEELGILEQRLKIERVTRFTREDKQ